MKKYRENTLTNFINFFKTTWLISAKLNWHKIFRVGGIHVCANEGLYPFVRGNDRET